MNTDIYILIEAPVLGELGQDSVIKREKDCEVCGKLKLTYEKIDFKFDRWNGEDFISAYGIYFISDRLKNKFEENDIIGLEYSSVSNSKAETFKMGKKAYSIVLPKFYHITITGKAKGPDPWWKQTRVCESCGDVKWTPTLEGLRSGNGPSTTGTKKDVIDPLPRRVYKQDWKGEDVFFLQDPVVQPIVTEKFKQITDQLENNKLFYRKTEWVEGLEVASEVVNNQK